jgi:hypothetical protein
MKKLLLIVLLFFIPTGWVAAQVTLEQPPKPTMTDSDYQLGNFGQKIELDLNGGLGFSSGGLVNPIYSNGPTSGQVGFGGGIGGYIHLDKNFSVGVIGGLYSFSESVSIYESSGVTVTNAITNGTITIMESLVAAKYRFDGNKIRPYLIFGVGIGAFQTSTSGNAYSFATTLPFQIDPMFALGAGLEFPVGNEIDIFIQDKCSVIIDLGTTVTTPEPNGLYSVSSGTTTESYSVIEGGLNFDL